MSSLPILTVTQSGEFVLPPEAKQGHTADGFAILPDHSILVLDHGGLYHLSSNGQFDANFGSGGFLNLPNVKIGNGLQRLDDGSFLVTGIAHGGHGNNNDTVVYKIRPDFSLDTSFGQGQAYVTLDHGRFESPGHIVLQSDGHILLPIASDDLIGSVVIRLLPNGEVDTAFGEHGSLSHSGELALQSDGKILVAWIDPSTASSSVVTRYLSNGQLDTAFGTKGSYTVPPSAGGAPYTHMTVLPDNSIVLAGHIFAGSNTLMLDKTDGNVNPIALYMSKLRPDGHGLDPNFGKAGVVSIFFDDYQPYHAPDGATISAGLVEQGVFAGPDQHLYVFGQDSMSVNTSAGFSNTSEMFSMRFDFNGRLDTDYGHRGVAALNLGDATLAVASQIAVDSDGAILLGGNTATSDGGRNYISASLARFNQQGLPDPQFGNLVSDNSIKYLLGYPAAPISQRMDVRHATLDALAAGQGDYSGAVLRLSRAGGASADDLFVGTGGLRLDGELAWVGGVAIASGQQDAGVLTLTFNHAATSARIDSALRSLGYQNMAQPGASEIDLQWQFNDGHGGQTDYLSHVQLSAKSIPYWIDAMLPTAANQDAASLRADYLSFLGAGHTFQVSFPNTNTDAGLANYNPRPMTAAEQGYTLHALDYVSTQFDLHFVAGSESGSNSLSLMGRETTTTSSLTPTGGAAYYPRADDGGSNAVISFLQPDSRNPAVPTFTLMHELGHALGLKHPFESTDGNNILPSSEQGASLSREAYYDSNNGSVPPYTYGVFDMAALDFIYGPAPGLRSADDTYVLNAGATNFIRDGGGGDTVSAGGLDSPLTLHLDPGWWDYLGAQRGALITSPGQVTINYGTTIENAIGGNGDDRLFGTAGANRLEGGSGNDMLTGGGGDDILIGGQGIDIAVFSGKRADYTFTSQGRDMLISGSDGKDTLNEVEVLRFSGGDYLNGIGGNTGQLTRLYLATFGRAPDLGGLVFWNGQMEHGSSLASVAQGFTASAEFRAGPGASGNNAAFLSALYQNVLHRSADADGLEYWLGVMRLPTSTQADILIGFSESAEFQVAVVGKVDHGLQFY